VLQDIYWFHSCPRGRTGDECFPLCLFDPPSRSLFRIKLPSFQPLFSAVETPLLLEGSHWRVLGSLLLECPLEETGNFKLLSDVLPQDTRNVPRFWGSESINFSRGKGSVNPPMVRKPLVSTFLRGFPGAPPQLPAPSPLFPSHPGNGLRGPGQILRWAISHMRRPFL